MSVLIIKEVSRPSIHSSLSASKNNYYIHMIIMKEFYFCGQADDNDTLNSQFIIIITEHRPQITRWRTTARVKTLERMWPQGTIFGAKNLWVFTPLIEKL